MRRRGALAVGFQLWLAGGGQLCASVGLALQSAPAPAANASQYRASLRLLPHRQPSPSLSRAAGGNSTAAFCCFSFVWLVLFRFLLTLALSLFNTSVRPVSFRSSVPIHLQVYQFPFSCSVRTRYTDANTRLRL